MLNKDVGFLAIDLPGHGYSSRFPNGFIYHYSNFLITVKSISKTFDWPKISLLGHSLGGIISYSYSMLYPAEIDFLICLDAVKPMVHKKRHIYFAEALEDFFKYQSFLSSGVEPPSYTIEEVTKMVSEPNGNSILSQYARYIYERNILPSKVHPGKYYFTRDPRLKMGPALFTYSQPDLVELAERVTMPVLITKGKETNYWERKEHFYEIVDVLKRVSSDCDFHYFNGTHHTHLNNPEVMSDWINSFIRRHNTENRSIGGIREDIVVNNVEKLDIGGRSWV